MTALVSSPGRDSRDLRSSRLAEATVGYGDVIKVCFDDFGFSAIKKLSGVKGQWQVSLISNYWLLVYII